MSLPTRTQLENDLEQRIEDIVTASGMCGYHDGFNEMRLKYDQRTRDATDRLSALLRQLLDCAYPKRESGGPS